MTLEDFIERLKKTIRTMMQHSESMEYEAYLSVLRIIAELERLAASRS